MPRQGDPYANAGAERVNGMLKMDVRRNGVFTTFDEAARAVEQSVRRYTQLRPHMSWGYLTPAAAHARTEPWQKRCKPYRKEGHSTWC